MVTLILTSFQFNPSNSLSSSIASEVFNKVDVFETTTIIFLGEFQLALDFTRNNQINSLQSNDDNKISDNSLR